MKIVIDHIAGSRRGQRQEFDLVAVLRFGRHPENDVSFDAHRDLDASSRHAELERRGEAFVLRDVGSSNGTFVDGAKVSEAAVTLGRPVEAQFGAGGPRLRIFIGAADEVPMPPTLPAELGMPPPTVGGGAAADRPIGQRTIAMMVRAAADEAGHKHGLARSTQFMKSLVDQALHASTRRFKFAMIGAGVLAVALVVALLLWQASERDRLDRMRASDVERIDDLKRDSLIRMDQMARIQLEGAGPFIASEYGAAVYLLVVETAPGEAKGFCTGFAVTDKHLGTNAHCVVEVNRFKAGNLPVYALRSGGGVARLPITDGVKHARYRGGLTEDVGLVTVDGTLAVLVRLARDEQLRELKKGANCFTLGFPGRLAKKVATAEAPEATIVNGIIGRMTTFLGERGSFDAELLVQHNLLTSPGTSGSPIFDGFGSVIAVNAGSYTETRTELLVNPVTGEKRELATSVLTPGANYAIRIDALRALARDNNLEIPDAPAGAAGQPK